MKIFWCAMLILLIMIVGAYYYTYVLDQTMLRLEDHINKLEATAAVGNWTDCEKILQQLISDWNGSQIYLNSFTDHKETDDIQKLISEIEGYTKIRDYGSLLVKTGVLRSVMQHMPKSEQLSLENILRADSTQNSQFFIKYSIPVKSSAFSVHINKEPSRLMTAPSHAKGGIK